MKIINVFKTHFDIGFTGFSSEIIARYGGKMLEDVLETCESTAEMPAGRRFVWTMSAWPLIKSLELCSPKNKERAEKLIKAGQLTCHALPYTIHTEFLSGKQLDRLFDPAREFCAKYGQKFPVSAKMTDVPGHTMGIIKPLTENGVRFLHLGCNPWSIPPSVPRLFFWEDKEGRRILVFYSSTYGSTLTPPEDWPFPVWLSLQQTGDNSGPQTADRLKELIDETEKLMPGAEISIGTLDDFYAEIIKCDLSGLPVIKKDLGDTWIHGVGTYPAEVSRLRRIRYIEDMDMSAADSAEYYENALLFGEHTWGMSVWTYLPHERRYKKEHFLEDRKSAEYQNIERSWDEQRERANACCAVAARYPQPAAEKCKKETQNEYYALSVKNGMLNIYDKRARVNITPEYRYEIAGTKRVDEFLRKYTARFTEWGVFDLGRGNYFNDIADYECGGAFERCEEKDGTLTLFYRADDEKSFKDYGNALTYSVNAWVEGAKVHIKFSLPDKPATPFIEAGNLFFHTDIKKGKYLIKKVNCVLDCEKDIQENANALLWCVDGWAQIGAVRIAPLDSPLVSFGESALYRFNGGTFRRPERNSFVFNLFNNMWGTNFPQWIEGSFEYEYIISAEK